MPRASFSRLSPLSERRIPPRPKIFCVFIFSLHTQRLFPFNRASRYPDIALLPAFPSDPARLVLASSAAIYLYATRSIAPLLLGLVSAFPSGSARLPLSYRRQYVFIPPRRIAFAVKTYRNCFPAFASNSFRFSQLTHLPAFPSGSARLVLASSAAIYLYAARSIAPLSSGLAAIAFRHLQAILLSAFPSGSARLPLSYRRQYVFIPPRRIAFAVKTCRYCFSRLSPRYAIRHTP